MKRHEITSTIAEIGIFAAIGYVLDELQGAFSSGVFINGGSIGFAMIAVIIIGIRRGFLPSLFTGLIMGLFDIATKAYIYHPAQVFLDYILPYALVAFGLLLRPCYLKSEKKIPWLIAITAIGGTLKLLSHFLSGVLFFADPSGFAWGMGNVSPVLYCFVYNFAFIAPSIVLTAALLIAIQIKGKTILESKTLLPAASETTANKETVINYSTSAVITVTGLAMFIVHLIQYINSYVYKDKGSYIKVSFNGDSMLIFVLGLILIGIGITSCILTYKKNSVVKFQCASLLITLLIGIVYFFARVIAVLIEEGPAYLGTELNSLLILLGIFVLVTGPYCLYKSFQKKESI